MTLVRVKVELPDKEGGNAPAVGHLRWSPTARRIVAGSPASIVLPSGFNSPLVDGLVDVTVDPTSSLWLWCVTEVFQGVPARRRYLAVPDQASVDYADLVELDPNSLDPVPGLDPAWAQPLADLAFRVDALTVTPDPDNPGLYLIGV